MWDEIATAVSEAEARDFRHAGREPQSVGGGCINDARDLVLVEEESGAAVHFFVKTNHAFF